MKTSVIAAFIGAMCLALVSMPANAQATRTWVSGVGDDANPCSRTAPCKTFAGAISKTATEGEINCLDPGGFGAVTITKSLTILCTADSNGGVLVSGTPGIVVNLPAATNRVILDGLDIEGVGTGTYGVRMLGLGQLIIRNTTIRNFTTQGVDIEGMAGTPETRVVMQNCLITNNGGAGSTGGGIFLQGSSGAGNNAEVLNTVVDSNFSYGMNVVGPGALVLSASTVTGQSSSIVTSNGGQVISYSNNVLRNAGAPTSTMPLQ